MGRRALPCTLDAGRPSSPLLPLHSPVAALRGGLSRALYEWAHFNGARAHGGNVCGDGDGFVEIFGLDEVIAAELLARLSERTVRHEAFAIAQADAGGCRRRLQLRTGQPLSGRLDLLGEFHEFPHEALPLSLAELTPSLFFVVNEQHIFHVCDPP